MAGVEHAEALKSSGNKLFGEKAWAEAVDKYSEALDTLSSLLVPPTTQEPDPSSKQRAGRDLQVTLLSNRAACFLSLEDHEACLRDTSAALKLEPSHTKARFRRARALAGMGRTRDALRDLQQLLGSFSSSSPSSSSSSSSSGASKRESKAATRLFKELQEKLKQEESGGRDKVSAALELLRDQAQPLQVLEQQCRILTAAVRTSEEWVRQLANKGAVPALWELASRERDTVQPLLTLEALASHARLRSEFLALDWATVMKQQLLHAPLATETDGPAAASSSAADDNDGPAAAAQTASVAGLSFRRLRALLQLWCTVVVPDPAAEEKALFEAKAGPASVDPAALMATVSDFERTCLLGIRRCLCTSADSRSAKGHEVDLTRRAAVDAVIRVTSLPRLAVAFAQPTRHGGGLLELLALLASPASTAPGVSTPSSKSSLSASSSSPQPPLPPQQQPMHRRAAVAASKLFGVLNGYEAMELPSKDKDGNSKESAAGSSGGAENLFVDRVVARTIVPLLRSDREYEQLRGLRGCNAFWAVAPKVGIRLLSNEATWPNAMSRLAFFAMSPQTEVQVEAARVIAYIAVHPEGRLHITELLVHTLQRLLDARALSVRAVAALVVSRHTYSSWDGESPEGAQLLNTCCDIVHESASALDRADDPDALASYEHAAEALSVLCMHYSAKANILGIVGSLTSLAKRGNERSSVWLALAVIFSELSTCQHHKNELKAREMEMTAEQFETLQMYNQMKKEKVVEPDSDAQVSARCAKMLSEGVGSALLRMSSARSERTRTSVALALSRLARERDHRGTMVQQGAVRACLRLLHSQPDLPPEIALIVRQTLSRLLMITNPSKIDSALVKDSVRQLIMLAKTDDPLYQFEGAMALTTVATLDDETKHLVVATDGGLDLLEKLQMSDHVMVRRASTEAMVNLVPCIEVYDMLKRHDGAILAVWVALANQEEDYETARAAAAMLAMVSDDDDICALLEKRELLADVVNMLSEWHEPEMQHRILFTLQNLIANGTLLRHKDQCRAIEASLQELELANGQLADLAHSISGSLRT